MVLSLRMGFVLKDILLLHIIGASVKYLYLYQTSLRFFFISGAPPYRCQFK